MHFYCWIAFFLFQIKMQLDGFILISSLMRLSLFYFMKIFYLTDQMYTFRMDTFSGLVPIISHDFLSIPFAIYGSSKQNITAKTMSFSFSQGSTRKIEILVYIQCDNIVCQFNTQLMIHTQRWQFTYVTLCNQSHCHRKSTQRFTLHKIHWFLLSKVKSFQINFKVHIKRFFFFNAFMMLLLHTV